MSRAKAHQPGNLFSKGLLVGLTFLVGNAFGQTLTITDIITSGPLDHSFAPGSLIYILGSFPHGAGRDFSVDVAGQTGGIGFDVGTFFISGSIPINAPSGPQTLILNYQGHSSNAFPITIQPLAPELNGAGITTTSNPPIQYNPYYPFTDASNPNFPPITPTSPASPGQPIQVSVYGLAQATPPAVAPVITVAGINATILMTQADDPGFATYYFQVPQKAPAGIDPVVVTVKGVAANTVPIPVGKGPAIGGVVNAANFGAAATVAAGSIVSIFGAGFGTEDNFGAFPSEMVSGLTASFGSAAAPIFALAAKEGQINVLVPDELPATGTIDLTIKDSAGTTAVFPLTLVAASPGMFFDTDPLVTTRKNVIAVEANTAWITMPVSMAANLGLPSDCNGLNAATVCGQPARPGDYIQIYATGLGRATPGGAPNGAVLPTGQVAPASGSPLYKTVAIPTVKIGGMQAKVLFSGLAAGFAGLYQVDVQIPSGVPTGDDIQIEISMPGSATDSATIAISK